MIYIVLHLLPGNDLTINYKISLLLVQLLRLSADFPSLNGDYVKS